MTMHFKAGEPVGQTAFSASNVFAQQVPVSSTLTRASITASAQPTTTCLSLAQVQLLGACFGKTPPPGMDPAFFNEACAAAKRNNLFGLPYCPGEQLPAVPGCLDATWSANLSYCEQYPNSDGPDVGKNAICWAARKSSAFYNAVKAAPPCGADADGGGGGGGPVQEDGEEPNYMLWGGLALLLVAAGGGIYYYAKKK